MIKRIVILAIASCFFLENIVLHLFVKPDATYCLKDTGEDDTPEKEDVAKKDKKEDYSISTYGRYYFVSDLLYSQFHFYSEQPYSAYSPEIQLPPPDLV